MNNVKSMTFSVSVVLFFPAAAWSQQCDQSIDSVPALEERVEVDNDGTLTDLVSGLTWMRCSLGQKWDGTTCVGSAGQYSWQEARDKAEQVNEQGGFASYSDWRLPKLRELASIADIRCRDPRINLTLFPNTPAAVFWTTDKKRGRENAVYTLSFGDEGVGSSQTDQLNRARLVRGRE